MSKPPLDEQSMLDFKSRYRAWRSSHCASLEIYGAHSKALSFASIANFEIAQRNRNLGLFHYSTPIDDDEKN